MKTLALLSVLVPVISAHTRFTTLFVNSQSQGDGVCIRMDMNPSTTTDWIPGLSSAEMACGVQGDTPVARTCAVKAGDSISLLHRLWTDGSQPGSIDPSHKGSTAVYMKKLADASSTDPYSTSASGDGWFKIAWDGLDTASGQWGTEKMIANGGMVSATVPSTLAAGYYLIRSEVLALQNIVDGNIQPQFYAGCAQVYLTGSGGAGTNPETVSIPGYINDQTPALSYDIYSTTKPAKPYVEFGPKVYSLGSSSTPAAFLERRRNRDSDNNSPAAWASYPSWAGHRRPWGNNQDNNSPSTSVDSPGDTSNSVVDDNSGPNTSIDGAGYNNVYAGNNIKNGGSTASTTSTVRVSLNSVTTGKISATITANNAVKTTAAASSSTSQSKATNSPLPLSSSSSTVPIGSCPQNTILEVANQCLTALDAWSGDTAGSLPKCWAASQKCWDKNQECWANLSPAINANDQNVGCHLWENFCNQIVDWCKAGNQQGPPDAGFGGVGAVSGQRREVMTRRNIAARHVYTAKRRAIK